VFLFRTNGRRYGLAEAFSAPGRCECFGLDLAVDVSDGHGFEELVALQRLEARCVRENTMWLTYAVLKGPAGLKSLRCHPSRHVRVIGIAVVKTFRPPHPLQTLLLVHCPTI